MQLTKPVTPWWFWLVAVLAVLWNLGGAGDYLSYAFSNEAYLDAAREMGPEAAAYIESMPSWAVGLWAAAVWFGLLGAVLLVLRRHFAVAAYAVSLVALLVGILLNLTVLGGAPFYEGSQLLMTVAIVLGAVFQLWFARHARGMEILR